MNWYYVEQGKQAGPVSDEQLDEMVRNGRITPDTLVWREGMADWIPCREARAQTVPPVTGAVAGEASPQAVCSECGKIFPVEETISYGNVRVCAACKPAFLQKLQEGASFNTGGLRYAGFWIRVAAKIIDGFIIGVPMAIVLFIVIFAAAHPTPGQPPEAGILPTLLPSLMQGVVLFIQMAYEIFFVGKYGATPGKMACGIKVVSSDGSRIGYGRATGRFFAEILSQLTC
jgi:RDD family/GYF domain 2